MLLLPLRVLIQQLVVQTLLQLQLPPQQLLQILLPAWPRIRLPLLALLRQLPLQPLTRPLTRLLVPLWLLASMLVQIALERMQPRRMLALLQLVPRMLQTVALLMLHLEREALGQMADLLMLVLRLALGSIMLGTVMPESGTQELEMLELAMLGLAMREQRMGERRTEEQQMVVAPLLQPTRWEQALVSLLDLQALVELMEVTPAVLAVLVLREPPVRAVKLVAAAAPQLMLSPTLSHSSANTL